MQNQILKNATSLAEFQKRHRLLSYD